MRRFLLPMLILWPFLFLLPYVVGFDGTYSRIANDFQMLYFSYKFYLLDCLSQGRIPWWSPSESAGFPFYSNPFTQTFYPFNLWLAAMYRLLGGYTNIAYQRFSVFGLSIFAVGLFFWLRSLRLNVRSCLFATLTMAVSFKMTELIRFPNAAHTAAWYPWILLALTRIFLTPATSNAVGWGLTLIGFFVCFLTAGYPYYVYYSVFLFVPYISLFVLPKVRGPLFGNSNTYVGRGLLIIFSAGAFALLACGPYLIKTVSLFNQTSG